MMELNKIYCEDCLQTIARIEDKSVDLVLADPPYNVGINYDDYNDKRENYLEWCKTWFIELKRITKHNILIFTGNDNYLDWNINIQKASELVIWYRSNSMVRNKYMYSWRKIEPIFFYELERNIKTFHDYYDYPISVQADTNGHPTPKSRKLFQSLLLDFSFDDQIVYDPFMGSGTTALACIKTNRNFIGSEISQAYVDLANKRIDQHLRQEKLF